MPSSPLNVHIFICLIQVSAQVREQLYALLYGHNRGEVEIPEPLLPWLASQYMRSSDLTATLTMLERNILGNVSLQLQEIKPQQSTEETVTQAIVQTTGAAGISEEVQGLVFTLLSQNRLITATITSCYLIMDY